MLAQPLVAKGVSTRYITAGARPIVDDLLAGESASCSLPFFCCCAAVCAEADRPFPCSPVPNIANEMLLGLKKAEAGSELVLKKPKKLGKKRRDPVNAKQGGTSEEE